MQKLFVFIGFSAQALIRNIGQKLSKAIFYCIKLNISSIVYAISLFISMVSSALIILHSLLSLSSASRAGVGSNHSSCEAGISRFFFAKIFLIVWSAMGKNIARDTASEMGNDIQKPTIPRVENLSRIIARGMSNPI